MFGENLKRIRVENNMTQKALADKLSVSFKTLSHWENNYTEPDIAQIKALREIFAVTYEDLLDD